MKGEVMDKPFLLSDSLMCMDQLRAGEQLRVLTVYGSEDGLLERDRLESGRALLPADAEEVVLPGGCHACFGSYGAQPGDGVPTITRAQQQEQTADLAAAFCLENAV